MNHFLPVTIHCPPAQLGSTAQLGRIARCDPWFGHREADTVAALHQREQQLFAHARGGIGPKQQCRLQGVGAEDDLGGQAASDDLIDKEVLGHRQAPAADVLGMTERPQTLTLGLAPQPVDQPDGLGPGALQFVFVGVHAFLDEVQDLVAQRPARCPER